MFAHIRYIRGMRLGMALVALSVAYGSVGTAAAAAPIEALHAALSAAPYDEDNFAAREAAIADTVRERFHLPRIARTIVGTGWRDLTAEQRDQLSDALGRLIAADYADRFANLGEHSFAIHEHKVLDDNRAIVRTALQREGRDNVSLVYHLLDNRIFNVVANGVSDLSLRRAQYGAVFRDQGLEGLLDLIETRVSAPADD